MTTIGCAGCGRCCERIRLLLTPADYDALIERENAGGRSMSAESRVNARWFRDHFVVDGTFEDGMVAVSCDAYDEDSKLCTAHDDRPPLCDGYPWYHDEPGSDPAVHLPAGCSYGWDLPVGHPDRGDLVGRLLPLWPS